MSGISAAERAARKQAQKTLEREVKRNVNRIKRFVREAEKRDYIFSDNVIPALPKKITGATLRKYQRITPESLYKKASYVTPEGKRIKGTKRRSEERSEAAKRGAVTRRATQVLKVIRMMIKNWSPNVHWSDELTELKRGDKNRLESVLDGAIAELGERQVAMNIQENADRVVELVDAIVYGESKDRRSNGETGREQSQRLIGEFAAIVRNKPLTVKESKEWTDMAEQADSLGEPE